jgi:hypothetical protein
MTKSQGIKKGDRVRLKVNLGGQLYIGTFMKGEYHKETKTFVIKVKKEKGGTVWLLAYKNHFSLEKYNDVS